MPWHLSPMKDAVNCDKLRGAVEQALIRRFPNEVTPPTLSRRLPAEYIGRVEVTQRTEISKYLWKRNQ